MADSKLQCSCPYSGLESIELETILKRTRIQIKRATSVQLMRRILKAEQMDTSAVELDQSEAVYRFCRSVLTDHVQNTKRKLMALEEQVEDGMKGMVVVTLKKQTSNSRQHLVLWAVVQIDLLTEPKVGYVRTFDITCMYISIFFNCNFRLLSPVEHSVLTMKIQK